MSYGNGCFERAIEAVHDLLVLVLVGGAAGRVSGLRDARAPIGNAVRNAGFS